MRNRLVLPTEAEWEYACRAGTDTPWISGRDVAALGKVANIADAWFKEHVGESIAVTPEVDDGHSVHAPVGSFAANAFGLHDVHGNLWEWCRDGCFPDAYAQGPRTDPVVQRGSGDRVLRGGSWGYIARSARSAYLRSAHIRVSRCRTLLPGLLAPWPRASLPLPAATWARP